MQDIQVARELRSLGNQLLKIASSLSKKAIAAQSERLMEFLAEKCHYVPGRKMKFKDLYDRFYEWLPPAERSAWSRQRTRRCLPVQYPSAAGSCNIIFVGNVSWEPDPSANALPLVRGTKGLTVDGA